MRIALSFDVPWTAYSVAFSGDGERLAIGGGTWYGFGGIAISELATRSLQVCGLAQLPGDPGQRGYDGSVSGLHWTRDDRHLFASTWGTSQHSGPALAIRVLGDKLREVRRIGLGGLVTPTGIVTQGTTAVVRTRSDHRNALLVESWRDVDLDPDPPVQHLTGNRVVIANERAVTGDHLVTLDRGSPLRSGLLVRQLGDSVTTHVHTPDLSRITAIGVTADGNLITGTEIGELDLWTWNPSGPLATRRLGVIPLPVVLGSSRWITYRPSSVVGICCLHDGAIAAVTAGGMLAISRPNQYLSVWQIPIRQSPRSIAAHPDRAEVAIGFKNGGYAAPESAVALVEVEAETIDPAWRVERVLAVAREADRKHPHETAALGVLADALEEIGAAPRVLAHLRGHDARCKDCWVVERLLRANDRSG